MYANSTTIGESTTTLQEYSLHMKNTNLILFTQIYIYKKYLSKAIWKHPNPFVVINNLE